MGYRYNYLKKHNKGIHICTYCGKPMSTNQMTVDHIIPQNLFRKINKFVVAINAVTLISSYVLKLMFPEAVKMAILSLIVCVVLWRVKDMNFNLVGSCLKCNQRKSDKMDLRIVFAFAVKSAPLLIVVFGLYYLVNHFFPGASNQILQALIELVKPT